MNKNIPIYVIAFYIVFGIIAFGHSWNRNDKIYEDSKLEFKDGSKVTTKYKEEKVFYISLVSAVFWPAYLSIRLNETK